MMTENTWKNVCGSGGKSKKSQEGGHCGGEESNNWHRGNSHSSGFLEHNHLKKKTFNKRLAKYSKATLGLYIGP